MAEGGSVAAMGRLGKVYHYGRGVPKDLHLARRWLRRAQERDYVWFPEYYETLLASDEKFHDEACKRCITLSDKGVKHAYVYRARMYRDGFGCEKNTDEAIAWYRKGVSEGMVLAAMELFEIFWANPSPATDKEMIDAILPFANRGSPGCMGRLGRAYHYGRGVPVNLAMAERWTAKACEKDPARWSKGLETIRLKRKSEKR